MAGSSIASMHASKYGANEKQHRDKVPFGNSLSIAIIYEMNIAKMCF